MLHWIWVILIGGVVGALAKLIMPGKDGGGILVTILLGIGGSLVGKLISGLIGFGDGAIMHFVLSVAGALLLLLIYRQIRPKLGGGSAPAGQ